MRGISADSIMENAVDNIVLIHGTFATDAEWVKEGSPLFRELRLSFPEANIECFRWTGDNLQEVRECEAMRLRNCLLALSGDPDKPRVTCVIAHSHGGNLAIDAIREGSPIPGFRCIVCLGTPFLRYTVQPSAAPYKLLEDFFSSWPLYYIVANRGHDPFVDLLCVNASATGQWLAKGCMLAVVFAIAATNSLFRGGLSVLVRKGMKSSSLLPASPTVPILALAHPRDEAFIYLKFHNSLTRVPMLFRWAALAVCVLFCVGIFDREVQGRYCYDVVMRIGWGLLSKPKAAVAGIYAGILIGELWAAVAILSLAVEAVWAFGITSLLHVGRGSRALGSRLVVLGLPQHLQIGFGETFRQTWVGSVSVRRLPEGIASARLLKLHYPAAGGLLHSAVCSAPEVISAVVKFLESPLSTSEPQPKISKAVVPNAPSRQLRRRLKALRWTIGLTALATVVYFRPAVMSILVSFVEVLREHRVGTQMDKSALQPDLALQPDNQKAQVVSLANDLRFYVQFIPNPNPATMVHDSAGAIHMRSNPVLINGDQRVSKDEEERILRIGMAADMSTYPSVFGFGGAGSTATYVILPISKRQQHQVSGVAANSGSTQAPRALEAVSADAEHLENLFNIKANFVILVGHCRSGNLFFVDGSHIAITRLLQVSRNRHKWVILIPCPTKAVSGRRPRFPTVSQSVQLASNIAKEIEKHWSFSLEDARFFLEASANIQGFPAESRIACEIPGEDDAKLAFGIVLCYMDDTDKLCSPIH